MPKLKIENNIIKRESHGWLEFLCWSIFIGSITFILIYGVEVLDVTNEKWLLVPDDIYQHYLGWKFFRRTEWQFPLGLINGLTEGAISVIYTDSIPLFAILFKILSPMLPDTFQYFGIWGLVCFILQVFWSMILLHSYVKDRWYVIIGSIIFVFSPIVLRRMFVHSALGGNWLIIGAMATWANRDCIKGVKENIAVWTIWMTLSVTLHMYFMPMIFAIMCACLLNQYLDDKLTYDFKAIGLTLAFSIASTLGMMYLLGAFYGSPDVLQSGVREYSLNLNAFYNPQGTSGFLQDRSLASNGQGEGYAYLGAGVFLGLLLGGLGWLISRKKVKLDKNFSLCLLILMIILCGYSLSPRITWNEKILLDIPWPPKVIDLFSVFRVTGRFIWPVFYIIFAATIVLMIKIFGRKIGTALLVLLTVVQLLDIYPLLISSMGRGKADVPSIIQDDAWEEMEGRFDKIEFITSFSEMGNPHTLIVSHFSMKEVFDLANYACENGMSLNDFYIGRRNGQYIEQTKYENWCALRVGDVDERTIYVFSKTPYNLIDVPEIEIYNCDGLIIGISSDFEWTHEPDNKITENTPIQVIQNNENIHNGEDIDGKRIIHPGGISFGPYALIDSGRYQVTVKGENLDKGRFDVFSETANQDLFMKNFIGDSQTVVFELEVKNMVYDMELRVFNEQQADIVIDEFYVQKTEGVM